MIWYDPLYQKLQAIVLSFIKTFYIRSKYIFNVVLACFVYIIWNLNCITYIVWFHLPRYFKSKYNFTCMKSVIKEACQWIFVARFLNDFSSSLQQTITIFWFVNIINSHLMTGLNQLHIPCYFFLLGVKGTRGKICMDTQAINIEWLFARLLQKPCDFFEWYFTDPNI